MKNLILNEVIEISGGLCVCYGNPGYRPGSKETLVECLLRANKRVKNGMMVFDFNQQDRALLKQITIPNIIATNKDISTSNKCKSYCRTIIAIGYKSDQDYEDAPCW